MAGIVASAVVAAAGGAAAAAPTVVASQPSGTAAHGLLPLQLLSRSADDRSGDGRTSGVHPTDDGHYVVFSSEADNLVADDSNNAEDCFLLDRHTGALELLSRTPTGEPGDDDSYCGSITDDGRYVVFSSRARDLVPGDVGSLSDIFRLDRATGLIIKLTHAADSGPANDDSFGGQASDDGRFVTFESFATNLTDDETYEGELPYDVFLYDVLTDTTTLVSRAVGGGPANGTSEGQAISADGSTVAFESYASNLVIDDSNSAYDVFLYDRVSGTLTASSLTLDGHTANDHSEDPDLSPDGRIVVFDSEATDLAASATAEVSHRWNVYRLDRSSGTTTVVSRTPAGRPGGGTYPAVSGDGRYIAYSSASGTLLPESIEGQINAYRYDLSTGRTVLITTPTDTGNQYNGYGVDVDAAGEVTFISNSRLLNQETGSYTDGYIRATGPR